jgi:hypothetical protein
MPKMNPAEILAAYYQAEAECDRLRRRLERQQKLFERVSKTGGPIIDETAKLLKAYHAATVIAQSWIAQLELRLRDADSQGGPMTEEDIVEVVDEIADDVDPPRIEREADRLGLTPDELLNRVVTEVMTRLA